MLTRVLRFGLAVLAIASIGFAAAALTADEIMDQVDAEADALAEGSMVSIIRFDNVYGDGTSSSNLFGSLAIPNRSLIYFMEPEDVVGTLFLTIESNDESGDSSLWLYLPFLGIAKELVSEEERGGSFAGSALSYSDLGDREQRDDYNAVLVGEETLVIGGQSRIAYKIESTAKPGTDTDTPRSIVWIDKQFLFMLKAESYNDLGNLANTMTVLELVTFEGKLTASAMLATNHSDGSTTTITVLERRRPGAPIPEATFLPDQLASFDAAAWGFAD